MNIKMDIVNTLKKYRGFSLDNHQHILMLADVLSENISSFIENELLSQEDIGVSVGFRDSIIMDMRKEKYIDPVQLEFSF